MGKSKKMATDHSEAARAQAARLFARAIQARDQGQIDLAEVLTAAAARALESAMAIDAALGTTPKIVDQPAQQQQQIQPDKDEPEKKE
jgi:hypothetical protein